MCAAVCRSRTNPGREAEGRCARTGPPPWPSCGAPEPCKYGPSNPTALSPHIAPGTTIWCHEVPSPQTARRPDDEGRRAQGPDPEKRLDQKPARARAVRRGDRSGRGHPRGGPGSYSDTAQGLRPTPQARPEAPAEEAGPASADLRVRPLERLEGLRRAPYGRSDREPRALLVFRARLLEASSAPIDRAPLRPGGFRGARCSRAAELGVANSAKEPPRRGPTGAHRTADWSCEEHGPAKSNRRSRWRH